MSGRHCPYFEWSQHKVWGRLLPFLSLVSFVHHTSPVIESYTIPVAMTCGVKNNTLCPQCPPTPRPYNKWCIVHYVHSAHPHPGPTTSDVLYIVSAVPTHTQALQQVMYCTLCPQCPPTPRPYNKRCIVHCVHSAHTHPGPTTSDVLYIVSTVPTHTQAIQQAMYCTLCPQCPPTPRPYNKWCIVHCVHSAHRHPGPTTSDVLYIVSTVPTHIQALQQAMYCTLCPQCPPTPRPYNKWCIVHCVHSAHTHPGPTTSDILYIVSTVPTHTQALQQAMYCTLCPQCPHTQALQQVMYCTLCPQCPHTPRPYNKWCIVHCVHSAHTHPGPTTSDVLYIVSTVPTHTGPTTSDVLYIVSTVPTHTQALQQVMYCTLCPQCPPTPRPYNKRCIVHCVHSAHTHPGPTTSDVLYIVSTVPTHTQALQQVMYCTLCPQCPPTPRPYNKWCIVHCVHSAHTHPGPTTSDVLYIVSTVPTHTQALQQAMYCTLCPQCPPTPRPYNKRCIVHCVHSAHPHPGPTTSDVLYIVSTVLTHTQALQQVMYCTLCPQCPPTPRPYNKWCIVHCVHSAHPHPGPTTSDVLYIVSTVPTHTQALQQVMYYTLCPHCPPTPRPYNKWCIVHCVHSAHTPRPYNKWCIVNCVHNAHTHPGPTTSDVLYIVSTVPTHTQALQQPMYCTLCPQCPPTPRPYNKWCIVHCVHSAHPHPGPTTSDVLYIVSTVPTHTQALQQAMYCTLCPQCPHTPRPFNKRCIVHCVHSAHTHPGPTTSDVFVHCVHSAHTHPGPTTSDVLYIVSTVPTHTQALQQAMYCTLCPQCPPTPRPYNKWCIVHCVHSADTHPGPTTSDVLYIVSTVPTHTQALQQVMYCTLCSQCPHTPRPYNKWCIVHCVHSAHTHPGPTTSDVMYIVSTVPTHTQALQQVMCCTLCPQCPHTPRPYNKWCIVHCVHSAHTHPGPTTSDVLYIVSTVPTHTQALQQVMYCTLCPQCPHTPKPYNKWCIVHCVHSAHTHPGPTTSDVLYIVSTVPTHTQALQQVMYCTLCPQCPHTPRPYNKWCIVHCVHSAHTHPGPTTSDVLYIVSTVPTHTQALQQVMCCTLCPQCPHTPRPYNKWCIVHCVHSAHTHPGPTTSDVLYIVSTLLTHTQTLQQVMYCTLCPQCPPTPRPYNKCCIVHCVYSAHTHPGPTTSDVLYIVSTVPTHTQALQQAMYCTLCPQCPHTPRPYNKWCIVHCVHSAHTHPGPTTSDVLYIVSTVPTHTQALQ